jgi:hypothetical protein
LIRRQLGNSFGDFFDLHVAQYIILRLPVGRRNVPMVPGQKQKFTVAIRLEALWRR